MCGISGIVGNNWSVAQLEAMLRMQSHRGPDASQHFISDDKMIGLGHNRLSIIDLSEAGNQPMITRDGRYVLVFNGEVYNYKELYSELKDYPFNSKTDSEVVLAAYQKWGKDCLDRFIGMFAFAIWDEQEQELFCARDRFGVKPLHYAFDGNGNFIFASEIKSLHTAGIPKEKNPVAWANYLAFGLYDHDEECFWKHIRKLLPGHFLTYKNKDIRIEKWYDLAKKIDHELDERPEHEIKEEYLSLLQESIKFRFRSDVPVGINLSGGLDSSILLGLVDQYKGLDNEIVAFTFATGDERYDELPWAKDMLTHTKHPHEICYLSASEVPALCTKIQKVQDEPFGGFPTLAYSKIFQRAREMGILVLLDGQGMDEQWAGYEYYRKHLGKDASSLNGKVTGPVQASKSKAFRVDCLNPAFVEHAKALAIPTPFGDALRNIQYRDAFLSKIPRALRFNDRISMLYSTELREPFLDHRLFELAFRQRESLKIRGTDQKYLLRALVGDLLPKTVSEAPKRPLQTPQREWLREDLKHWVNDCIQVVIRKHGGDWMDSKAVLAAWDQYQKEPIDNSFFIWQWISLALID